MILLKSGWLLVGVLLGFVITECVEVWLKEKKK